MGLTRKQIEIALDEAKKERDELLAYLIVVARQMGPLTINKRLCDEADQWTLKGEAVANGEALKLQAIPRTAIAVLGSVGKRPN